jgi:hypothetical protein
VTVGVCHRPIAFRLKGHETEVRMLWSSSITAIVGIDCTILPRRCFQQSAWRECDGEEKGGYVFDKNFEMWQVCNRIGRPSCPRGGSSAEMAAS